MKYKVISFFALLVSFLYTIYSQTDSLSKDFYRELQKNSSQFDSLRQGTELNLGATILETLLYLILIIGIIIAFIWLLKKIKNKTFSGEKNYLIDVVESRYINSKQAFYLVKILDKMFLIGVSDNNMSKLGEFMLDENIDITKIKFENELEAEIGNISSLEEDYAEKIKKKLDNLKNGLDKK